MYIDSGPQAMFDIEGIPVLYTFEHGDQFGMVSLYI